MTDDLQAAVSAPLAHVEDALLLDAIGRFGTDVLRQWGYGGKVKVWDSPTSGKDYTSPANGKRQVEPSDLLGHFRGEKVIAVGPIARALVIDADLDANDDEQIKRAGGEYVSLVLDSFGIPYVHHDGRSGYHTWIRLHRDSTREEIAALAAILNREGKTFQVFPLGGTALRLPFGLYCGKPRHTVPAQDPAAYIRWLTDPDRATGEQLTALVEKAPKPARTPKPPARPATPPAGEAAADHDVPASPAPITGWERWPDCKRALATSGPLPHRRHNTMLALACEAVESGERSEEHLTRFLASIPRPHSRTGRVEHEADARRAARDALRLHAEDDPRRFSSCPHIPGHSEHPAGSQHRDTFEHECTPERAATCPIYRHWQRAQNLPAYRHIIDSSIWRSGRGAGAGLGQEAKAVYGLMLYLSGGDPERVITAAIRYIAIKLPNEVNERSVHVIRDRLLEHGLIIDVDKTKGRFRVPLLTPARITALEAELGTDELLRRERKAILRHWQKTEQL